MRELVIDLDAIASNLNRMRQVAPGSKICAVVKADAYGHGMVPVAKRLEREGVDYLGVADIDEALTLRQADISTPILAWLHSPDEDFEAAVAAHIDLGVSSAGQLRRVIDAGKRTGVSPKVHLKVDTGLGRNGVTTQDLSALLDELAEHLERQDVALEGVFSHLSCTSREDDLRQIEVFDGVLEQLESAGLKPALRHLTASDGTLSYPEAHFDMVRIGVALYGLSPYSDHSSADYGLTPAMTATARVSLVKRVPENTPVSYGYLYRTARETQLALVPVGYAEGLPRLATGNASVWLNGLTFKIESRIAMDQFVLDVDDASVAPGDTVVLFGDPAKGYPSADSLAEACQTINYEIVTRMGGRFKRVYLQDSEKLSEAEAAR